MVKTKYLQHLMISTFLIINASAMESRKEESDTTQINTMARVEEVKEADALVVAPTTNSVEQNNEVQSDKDQDSRDTTQINTMVRGNAVDQIAEVPSLLDLVGQFDLLTSTIRFLPLQDSIKLTCLSKEANQSTNKNEVSKVFHDTYFSCAPTILEALKQDEVKLERSHFPILKMIYQFPNNTKWCLLELVKPLKLTLKSQMEKRKTKHYA